MKDYLNRQNQVRLLGIGSFLLTLSFLFIACSPQIAKTSEEVNTPVSVPVIVTPNVESADSPKSAVEELIQDLEFAYMDDRKKVIEKLVEMGAPAVDPLIIALQNRYSTTQIGAAQALGQIKDPRAVEPLTLALQDEFSLVRKEAAEALGVIRDPRAVEALIVALQDEDTLVREAAAEALGKINDPRAVEPLVKALSDEHAFVRQKAAVALGEIRDARAVEPIMNALMTGDSYQRDLLMQALVMIGTPSVKPLIEVLDGEDQEIQALAVDALGQIKDPEGVAPLIGLLKNENTDDLIPIANALVMIGEPAVDPLIATLGDDDIEVRAFAVKALGEIKDTRAVEPLVLQLMDEDFYYRYWAATALGEINDPRAIEPLIASMKGNDRAVQEEAKNSLVKIGLPAVEPLIKALKNKDPGIRRFTVVALGKIKDPRAVEPLIESLHDEDFYVRQQVPRVLAEINDPRAVEPLIASLQDKWSAVRMAVADALGIIKDPRSVEPLISAMKDKDLYVRRQVARALGEIRDVRAIDTLIAGLNDEAPEVQIAAALALSGFNDPRAVTTLITAFQNKELEIIAGAYSFYISRVEDGAEALLIEALNKYGNRQMAEDFLNCGNDLLTEAGTEWAHSKDYTIETGPTGRTHPRWGSGQ